MYVGGKATMCCENNISLCVLTWSTIQVWFDHLKGGVSLILGSIAIYIYLIVLDQDCIMVNFSHNAGASLRTVLPTQTLSPTTSVDGKPGETNDLFQ